MADEEEKNNKIDTEKEDSLMAAIEAILFAMGDSVEISVLSRALNETPSQIRFILGKLMEKYDAPSSGLSLRFMDDAVQLSTKAEQYENLIKVVKVPKKLVLSQAVMETLSIIAYRQPVTKMEIEDIRGVSCDYAVNKLLDYDLIEETGRKDAPGRPILFGTTQQFLRAFGMGNLKELPSMDSGNLEQLKKEAEEEADQHLEI